MMKILIFTKHCLQQLYTDSDIKAKDYCDILYFILLLI